MEKVSANLGIYLGLLSPKTGKLLLIRRTSAQSIIPNVSFRGNWELPGGAVLVTDKPSIPYDYHLRELSRLVEQKTGISVYRWLSGMPPMSSVMFKGPAGYDFASVTTLLVSAEPTVGEGIWVSPEELAALAAEFEPANEKAGKSGKGLVSGTGKRMHCMALAALRNSLNKDYAEKARWELAEFTSAWG